MTILLIGDRKNFIRWKDTSFVPTIMKAWNAKGRHEFGKVTFLLLFLLVLSVGSESRASSGGSAQDNVSSKGIRGSTSSRGWIAIQRRLCDKKGGWEYVSI